MADFAKACPVNDCRFKIVVQSDFRVARARSKCQSSSTASTYDPTNPAIERQLVLVDLVGADCQGGQFTGTPQRRLLEFIG